jgi:hypothetical protein
MAIALYVEQNEIDLELTSQSCTVPANPYIQLAYYLNAVRCTDCPNSIPTQLSNWQSMLSSRFRTTAQLQEIMEWAECYAPYKMKKWGYFIMASKDALTRYSNEFVTLSATSTELGVLATSEAALALVRRSTASVNLMLYKEIWEDNNFYGPRRRIQAIIAERNRSHSGCSVA